MLETPVRNFDNNNSLDGSPLASMVGRDVICVFILKRNSRKSEPERAIVCPFRLLL